MEPPSSRVVTILNDSGRSVSSDLIEHAVAGSAQYKRVKGYDVRVLLTSDEQVRELNRTYRGIDESTDVLSFVDSTNPIDGDIAIAMPYALRQAERRNVPLEQEIAYLAIHGTLHLTGMDDLLEVDRTQMIAEMNEIAEEIGVPADHQWHSILHGDPA